MCLMNEYYVECFPCWVDLHKNSTVPAQVEQLRTQNAVLLINIFSI